MIIEKGRIPMKKFTCSITNPAGMHTRHAGLLVKSAKDYDNTMITISKDGTAVKASQLMKLMGLSIKQEDKITVIAEGPDEDEAIAAMETLFRENLCSNDISIETSSVQFDTITDKAQGETEKENSALICTMDMGEWIHCPWCGNKTRLKIRADTEIKNFPLFCPKCRHESLIAVEKMNITVIKEPDA